MHHMTIRLSMTITLSLTGAACGTADDVIDVDPDASTTGTDCPRPPDYREIECITLCVPELGLCAGADQEECERQCERMEPTGSYCPGGL